MKQIDPTSAPTVVWSPFSNLWLYHADDRRRRGRQEGLSDLPRLGLVAVGDQARARRAKGRRRAQPRTARRALQRPRALRDGHRQPRRRARGRMGAADRRASGRATPPTSSSASATTPTRTGTSSRPPSSTSSSCSSAACRSTAPRPLMTRRRRPGAGPDHGPRVSSAALVVRQPGRRTPRSTGRGVRAALEAVRDDPQAAWQDRPGRARRLGRRARRPRCAARALRRHARGGSRPARRRVARSLPTW